MQLDRSKLILSPSSSQRSTTDHIALLHRLHLLCITCIVRSRSNSYESSPKSHDREIATINRPYGRTRQSLGTINSRPRVIHEEPNARVNARRWLTNNEFNYRPGDARHTAVILDEFADYANAKSSTCLMNRSSAFTLENPGDLLLRGIRNRSVTNRRRVRYLENSKILETRCGNKLRFLSAVEGSFEFFFFFFCLNFFQSVSHGRVSVSVSRQSFKLQSREYPAIFTE